MQIFTNFHKLMYNVQCFYSEELKKSTWNSFYVFHLKTPVEMVSKCMKNKMCQMTCFCINITPLESEPWRNVLICPVRKPDCIRRFSVFRQMQGQNQ